MTRPSQRYVRRQYHFSNLINQQTRVINRISKLRLIVFLLGTALTIFMYATHNYYLSLGIFSAAFVLFVYLVIVDSDLEKKRTLTKLLLKINEDSINRLKGEWKNFTDLGSEFGDYEHPFSEDLDLFGRSSLFQWTNASRTFLGRRRFAQILREPLKEVSQISKRQEAVLELSTKLEWRQRFQAEAEVLKEKEKSIDALKDWSKIKYPFYDQNWVSYLVWILPIITLGLIMSSILLESIRYYHPLVSVVLQFLLLRWKKNEHKAALDTIYPYRNTIATYESMLKKLEAENFKASLILELKTSLQTKEHQSASHQIHKLVKIVDGISNRMNALYIIVDVLFLWDFHLMIALEKWKAQTGHLMMTWLEVLAEMEALSSLAIISFDHPNWCMPTFVTGEGLSSRDLGHPLLGDQRRNNPVNVDSATTLLITGSNMSGKSTLLRTVGINLLLAYSGAPVCANQLTCDIMDIYTCMRVRDDLEQSISSFYAELLRIKQIVSSSKDKRNVFFLLDEVFKGTNSEDRHLGAKFLIKQLGRQGATGLVSTHDLELGGMEEEMKGKVKNFHFREYYENNQIHFDYILRPGISTTKNALYLIKMAGIEVE